VSRAFDFSRYGARNFRQGSAAQLRFRIEIKESDALSSNVVSTYHCLLGFGDWLELLVHLEDIGLI
jgi:hypothetical protein